MKNNNNICSHQSKSRSTRVRLEWKTQKVEVSNIRDRKLLVTLEYDKRPGSILPDNVAEKLKTLAEVDIKIGTRRGKVTANLVLQGEDEENTPKGADFAVSLKKALTE